VSEFPIWRIREATAGDCHTLALVGAATFLESFAGMIDGAAIVAHCARQHSAETYRAYLAKGACAWIGVVEPGGAPVGYALVCDPELEQAQPGDLELKRIYLFSRFKGSPLASALMQAAINHASNRPRLLLGVKNDNHRAIAFYRKHGFETIGTRTFTVGDKSYDDLVMARSLTAPPT